MFLFKCLFFMQELHFVVFELLLARFSLSDVFSFKLSDLLFPVGAFLCLRYLLLLPRDDWVSVTEESFNFFFIGILNRSLHVTIFFVFAMQVEDNFCQLRDLLWHLMMRFFTHLHRTRFIFENGLVRVSIVYLFFLPDWWVGKSD